VKSPLSIYLVNALNNAVYLIAKVPALEKVSSDLAVDRSLAALTQNRRNKKLLSAPHYVGCGDGNEGISAVGLQYCEVPDTDGDREQ